MPVSGDPVLSVQRLTAGYGDRRVLDGVTFAVRAGELWAVLGPNGAGKSTLVRACLGLLPQRTPEAAVTIGGRPLAGWSREELARYAAWVPQSTETAAGFTGMELVLMGRTAHLGRWGLPSRADLDRARDALRALSIESLAARPVDRLSGGERRLLFFARALAQDPTLLFLDEPTAFLDLRHQVEALGVLRQKAKAGVAVVAVLHDVNLAAAFADHVLLLRDGKVQAAGPTTEVLQAPALRELYGVEIAQAAADGQPLFAPRPAP